MTMETHIDTVKLYTLDLAVEQREALRQEGKVFVLTNGCFDLMHPGHVTYLKKAKALGDYLCVALNSAKSVKALKGEGRPILDDEARACVLGGLASVDAITIFDTLRLDKEILALKPDVYVKAGDYTEETLDPKERSALKAVGAKINIIPFVPGYSTTGLIKQIVEAERFRT